MIPQTPPFAIQMEPVEGCNLACAFCGIQSIRANGAELDGMKHGKNSSPFKYMNIDLATHIAKEIRRLDWNPRLEFAMHGEPTLNKDLPTIIWKFRHWLPRSYIMVTSNGGGLLKGAMLEELFDAGLNTFALDDYRHARIVPALRDKYPPGSVKGVQFIEYPENPEGNPHQRHRGKKLVWVKDISVSTKGTHSHLSNHALNSGPPDESYAKKRCAKPFREMAIRWNGDVALCCVDWPGHYKIGNVGQMPLDELWNHKHFQAARRILMHDGRAMIPCIGCNEAVNRPGLLPDKFGKEELLAPTEATYRVAARAIEGEPFTPRVKEIYE